MQGNCAERFYALQFTHRLTAGINQTESEMSYRNNDFGGVKFTAAPSRGRIVRRFVARFGQTGSANVSRLTGKQATRYGREMRQEQSEWNRNGGERS